MKRSRGNPSRNKCRHCLQITAWCYGEEGEEWARSSPSTVLGLHWLTLVLNAESQFHQPTLQQSNDGHKREACSSRSKAVGVAGDKDISKYRIFIASTKLGFAMSVGAFKV